VEAAFCSAGGEPDGESLCDVGVYSQPMAWSSGW